jgi:hypothetical protein
MKILRAKRDYSRHDFVQQAGKETRRQLFFYGQEGYFNASLYEAFDDITVVKARALKQYSQPHLNQFDVLVVNKKTDVLPGLDREGTLKELADNFPGSVVLIDASDNAYDIPSEDAIDNYDLVFKRECLQDKSKYGFTKRNQDKLRTTMLPCLFIPLPRYSFSRIFEKFFIPQAPPELNKTKEKHDGFFCGNANAAKSSRVEAVRKLKEDPDINFYGGLQPESENDQIPESLRFDRLNSDEYVRAMRNSKIALSLDGLGQLTFRHLEVWHLGSFLLSSPSIQDITMPLSAKKDEHYAVFDGIESLVDTVKYYLKNDSERHYIAEAGKEVFASQYDPKKHADYINSEIMSKAK